MCFCSNVQCVDCTECSIPCCAAVGASISVEGLLSAVVVLRLLRGPGNDGTESGSEESWSVYVRRSGSHSKSVTKQCHGFSTLTHDSAVCVMCVHKWLRAKGSGTEGVSYRERFGWHEQVISLEMERK